MFTLRRFEVVISSKKLWLLKNQKVYDGSLKEVNWEFLTLIQQFRECKGGIKMKKNYQEGFDIEGLARAIEQGEHFKNVERKVEFVHLGKGLPAVQKTVLYVVNDEFIEANEEKLLKLNIIK